MLYQNLISIFLSQNYKIFKFFSFVKKSVYNHGYENHMLNLKIQIITNYNGIFPVTLVTTIEL